MSSSIRVLLGAMAALALGGAGFYAASVRRPATAPVQDPGPPWSSRISGRLLTVSWNRQHPEFRDVRELELLVSDGPKQERIQLQREAGTILLPLTSEQFTAKLQIAGGARDAESIDLMQTRNITQPASVIQPSDKTQPEVTPPAVPRKLTIPVILDRGRSGRRAALRSEATAIMPELPSGFQGTERVQLSVKISPQGRVSSVASTPGAGAAFMSATVRRAAEDAVLQWRFNPVGGMAYRDARLRFEFSPTGVRLLP
ncbi:MAG: hypothetical protein H7039_15220 [Bryobacteraceae bacterium]|nr:hypothetical protein [Bryobacteraceae bacterium]